MLLLFYIPKFKVFDLSKVRVAFFSGWKSSTSYNGSDVPKHAPQSTLTSHDTCGCIDMCSFGFPRERHRRPVPQPCPADAIPLRLCEGEGGMEARARPGPRARFEALTSDRNPSSTTTRQPLRRAPPGAEVSLSPANGRQKARAPTPIYSLAHSSTWSTAPLAWVCGSCPGKMLGDGACEVRTLQKSNMNNGVQCSPGRWATGSFPIILCQFRVLI